MWSLSISHDNQKTSSRGWEVRTCGKYCPGTKVSMHTHKNNSEVSSTHFFFFLDVQKSCKNHTLTLKCLIPHLNRLVFIWRQWTDHLWTYKTMDHKSGTKSDNKMQKTQIEKDDDAEKNTLTTYNHKTYPLKICEGLVSSPGDHLKMFQTHAFVY